jgi:hypothetical protein
MQSWRLLMAAGHLTRATQRTEIKNNLSDEIEKNKIKGK